jgi:Holliday junction resolvase
MLESPIKKKIQTKLIKAGWIVLRPVSITKSGFADLFCFRNKITVFIETKRTGDAPRRLQDLRKRQLEAQGFEVIIADNDNAVNHLL